MVCEQLFSVADQMLAEDHGVIGRADGKCAEIKRREAAWVLAHTGGNLFSLANCNSPTLGDIHQLAGTHNPAGRTRAARERERPLRCARQRSS